LLVVVSSLPAFISASQPSAAPSTDAKTASEAHGHLPPYYSKVVTDQQRQEIYRIQTEYQERISTLENQWKAMKQERDKKIAAVLTEEQRKQVEKIAAEAKTSRTKKNPAKP
jgi:Spy/CpxP family protein refolding chaperone